MGDEWKQTSVRLLTEIGHTPVRILTGRVCASDTSPWPCAMARAIVEQERMRQQERDLGEQRELARQNGLVELERVTERMSDEAWVKKARDFVISLPQGALIEAIDVTSVCGFPLSPNRVGAVFTGLSHRKPPIIVRERHTASPRPRSNGSEVSVWRRT